MKSIVTKYKGKSDNTTSTLFFKASNSSQIISELLEIMTDKEDGLLILEFHNKVLEHTYRYEQGQSYIDKEEDTQWFIF